MIEFLKSQAHHVKPTAIQFGRYLLSGGSAAAVELLSYKLFLVIGIPYAVGGVMSSVLGTVSAFLFHKYFSFKKRGDIAKHSIKYGMLTGFNFIAQNALLIAFVEGAGITPMWAKILSIGCAVCWNFILYKFVVYA